MKASEVRDDGRGRQAETPSELPAAGWKDILWRVWAEFNDDRVMLIAAGATFYLLLALFPALAAFVSIYGFVADPTTIADHLAFLGGVLPSGGVELIQSQLQSLVSADPASLSWAFVFGLVLALYSANNGIKTLFEATNIAYDETEKRSFIWLNVVSLGFTLGAIAIGILFITMVGVVPAVLAFVGLGPVAEVLISLLRWPVLFAASVAAISLLYRYGPSRNPAKWRWVTWGSAFATGIWLITSFLFSWYLANFADYNATYGSLGAVIGFMMWVWISVTIVICGAELNSEMEHQTARDSTVGKEMPLGQRGASMADKVADVVNKSDTPERSVTPKPGQEGEQPGGGSAPREPQSSSGTAASPPRGPGRLAADMPRAAAARADEPSSRAKAAGVVLPLVVMGVRYLKTGRL